MVLLEIRFEWDVISASQWHSARLEGQRFCPGARFRTGLGCARVVPEPRGASGRVGTVGAPSVRPWLGQVPQKGWASARIPVRHGFKVLLGGGEAVGEAARSRGGRRRELVEEGTKTKVPATRE